MGNAAAGPAGLRQHQQEALPGEGAHPTLAHNKKLELSPEVAVASWECLCRRSANSDAAAQLNSSLGAASNRGGPARQVGGGSSCTRVPY